MIQKNFSPEHGSSCNGDEPVAQCKRQGNHTLSWEAKKKHLSYLNTEGRQLDMVSFCSLKVTNGS